MKRFIVIVLDGFGIGAMDDVPALRPKDTGANTCRHIFESRKNLELPVLEKLGLGNALLASEKKWDPGNPHSLPGMNSLLPPGLRISADACFGFHKLAHFGADTFWGHQELMGTKPRQPVSAPLFPLLPLIWEELEKHGYRVRFYNTFMKNSGNLNEALSHPGLLIVNEAVTIGDNLETDLGNNYNVTAALDLISFDEVKKIGAIVRSLVKVSRVIVFGGAGVQLPDLLNAFEGKDSYAGVSAPRSGVYRSGYQVIHLGYGVNPALQVPACMRSGKIKTVLIGKVADIIENSSGISIPGVDTEEVLRTGRKMLDEIETGFICINVQETDLAGHREDAALYAGRLELADRGIGKIMEKMDGDDCLVICADHGNDPLIGHTQHTREKTPILVYGPGIKRGYIRERDSLADTGATACAYFNVSSPEFGTSYLPLIVAS